MSESSCLVLPWGAKRSWKSPGKLNEDTHLRCKQSVLYLLGNTNISVPWCYIEWQDHSLLGVTFFLQITFFLYLENRDIHFQ